MSFSEFCGGYREGDLVRMLGRAESSLPERVGRISRFELRGPETAPRFEMWALVVVPNLGGWWAPVSDLEHESDAITRLGRLA